MHKPKIIYELQVGKGTEWLKEQIVHELIKMTVAVSPLAELLNDNLTEVFWFNAEN